MTRRSTWRGHKIEMIAKRWVFADTGEPTVGSVRPCGHCHEYRTAEGHDACLGILPGVQNACCGHGQITEAYVQMNDRSIIRGRSAMKLMGDVR